MYSDKNLHDIQNKLEAVQDIHPEESLKNRSDDLFAYHLQKQQEKFAKKHPKNWFFVRLYRTIQQMAVHSVQNTYVQRTAAVSAAMIAIFFCASVLLHERGALADTLDALLRVQSMKLHFTSTTDGSTANKETVIWQSPDLMKVEQYGISDAIEKSYWLDGSRFTVINHKQHDAIQQEYSQGEAIRDTHGTQWIANATSPMQIVLAQIDYIQHNWDTISVREDGFGANAVTTYTFDYDDGRTTKLTIDSQSDLPLYLHFVYPANESHGLIENTFQFDWNMVLGDDEFIANIPNDYEIRTRSEVLSEERARFSYPGGFNAPSARYDMNPAGDPPATEGLVTGSVVDEDGNPVVNAQVGFYHLPSYNPSLSAPLFEPKTTTNASGYFDFDFDFESVDRSWNGAYIIQCVADGYETLELYVHLDEFSPSAHIEFILRPGFSVSGRVVDENNNPIVNVRAYLKSALPQNNTLLQYNESISKNVVTNENGEFTLNGFGNGDISYQVYVSKSGYKQADRQATLISGNGVKQPSITLEEDIVLVPNPDYRTRWIHVVDTHGNPVAGAAVNPHSTDLGGKTDEQGRFELSGYVSPTHAHSGVASNNIFVLKEGYAFHFAEINLLDEEPYIAHLTPSRSVKGKVVDQYGDPVQGVVFTYYFSHHYTRYGYAIKSDPTDENGQFEVNNLNQDYSISYEIQVPDDLPYIFRHGIYYNGNYLLGNLMDLPEQQSDEPLVVTVDRLPTIEGYVVYEDTFEPVPYFTTIVKRDSSGTGVRGIIQKGYGMTTVYQSTSGYFNTQILTDPVEGYRDEIRIRVKEGAGHSIPEAEAHMFTFSLDEVKEGPLQIQIPRVKR